MSHSLGFAIKDPHQRCLEKTQPKWSTLPFGFHARVEAAKQLQLFIIKEPNCPGNSESRRLVGFF
jgi:hypothetical protein